MTTNRAYRLSVQGICLESGRRARSVYGRPSIVGLGLACCLFGYFVGFEGLGFRVELDSAWDFVPCQLVNV